jgi:hypothetical protein
VVGADGSVAGAWPAGAAADAGAVPDDGAGAGAGACCTGCAVSAAAAAVASAVGVAVVWVSSLESLSELLLEPLLFENLEAVAGVTVAVAVPATGTPTVWL